MGKNEAYILIVIAIAMLCAYGYATWLYATHVHSIAISPIRIGGR